MTKEQKSTEEQKLTPGAGAAPVLAAALLGLRLDRDVRDIAADVVDELDRMGYVVVPHNSDDSRWV